MQRHGWTLLFHEGVVEQLQRLHTAVQRAEQNDAQGFESNANVKLFRDPLMAFVMVLSYSRHTFLRQRPPAAGRHAVAINARGDHSAPRETARVARCRSRAGRHGVIATFSTPSRWCENRS